MKRDTTSAAIIPPIISMSSGKSSCKTNGAHQGACVPCRSVRIQGVVSDMTGAKVIMIRSSGVSVDGPGSVTVGDGIWGPVADGTGVAPDSEVMPGVLLDVGVQVGVLVCVAVALGVGVWVGVSVMVKLGVTVRVAVALGVAVRVQVGGRVGGALGSTGAGVSVGTAVSDDWGGSKRVGRSTPSSPLLVSHAANPLTSTASNRILKSICNLFIAPLYP